MASATFGTALRHLRDLFGTGTVGGLEDGQLLARYSSAKDELAFEALVARHGPMVLATCRAVLRNEHDVEDAFQTTFFVLARKAHSIRGGDALGGWLHRVAFRAAVTASMEARKRPRQEAEALAMALVDAIRSAPPADDDLQPILHEEINRLPESQRLPVVLCDLEGLSYAQAAGQLRWTVPALRCRLAKARQRLKARLTRRGFAAPAVGAAFGLSEATAAVPAALARAAVLAASGGPVRDGTVLLAQILLKEMLMTKIRFAATAALAAAALASAGVVVIAGGGRPEGLKATLIPQAQGERAGESREKPAVKRPVETVEIKARVVAPDGKPVAGAVVTAAYIKEGTDPWPEATSGPDGRFAIRLPKPDTNAPAEGEMALYPWIIAWAPGYGVGWSQRALRADRPDEQEVKLVEEGPPIEGRIVDLEGKPVGGATIEAAGIWYDESGDIVGWIAKARNGAAGNLWQGLEQLVLDSTMPQPKSGPRPRPIAISTKSGADGRFKLTGIGRDRIADLIVSGPGVATTQVDVFSRNEAEIRAVDRAMLQRQSFIVHAPNFQLALAPSKRLEGVIRDKDSGKPIAGMQIQAAVFDESSLIPDPGIQATTDQEGRYRLDGLSRAPAYRLFITATKGLPYINASLKVPAESPPLEPVTFDVAMKRGVIVRGKVVDKSTGRPIKGDAHYFCFSDNPNVREYSGFAESEEPSAWFNDEGRYEIVALPGRGLIAFREALDRYRPASGYEKIAGYDAKNGMFNTQPTLFEPGGHNIVAEVVVDPKAESMTLDLQADPGQSVQIEVVGPDGAPISDTKVKGLRELFQSGPVPQVSSSFEVHALDRSSPRRVIVMHEGRKLIGSVLLKGDEPGPVTVKLVPWGSVSGRIVDDEGRPRKAMFISSPVGSENKHPETHDILPGSDWNNGVRVGDDGRFLIEGLVPGLKYSANSRTGFEPFGDLFVDVTIASGEAKDLGDLKVQPPKQTKEE
jgi:RNA polymerase sigma factor (sigma-70 family)